MSEQQTHQCPRCGANMLTYYRKDPHNDEYAWSWLCPDCRNTERVPQDIVDSFLKES